MIGLLHPPMGMVLFVLARVAGLSFEPRTMAILPWLVPLLLSLVVLTYVPAIGLWLPRLLDVNLVKGGTGSGSALRARDQGARMS